VGQGENRRKARRLVDQDKGGLAGKAKAVHTSKAKRNIQSLLPIGEPVFSHFLESRTPSHVMVTWEDKHCNYKHSLFLLLSTSFSH